MIRAFVRKLSRVNFSCLPPPGKFLTYFADEIFFGSRREKKKIVAKSEYNVSHRETTSREREREREFEQQLRRVVM